MTTVIGVLHLTSTTNSPTSNQTPATILLSHLSDLYPTETHVPFTLDHRLFVSTSSLLPHTESKRAFTQLFTSSHAPGKTYVGTTLPPTATAPDAAEYQNPDGSNTITIPTSASLEPFTTLLSQKLQPQWAPRQFVVLDNGASVVLPITDDAKWRISVGDLRLSQSRVSGPAAGQLRGLVIEVQYQTESVEFQVLNEKEKEQYESLFRALLESLFKKVKLDLKLDESKIYLTSAVKSEPESESKSEDTGEVQDQQQQQQQTKGKPTGFAIADLYMEVLRGPRG